MPIEGVRALGDRILSDRVKDPDTRDALRTVEYALGSLVDSISRARVYGAGDIKVKPEDTARANTVTPSADLHLIAPVYKGGIYSLEAFLVHNAPSGMRFEFGLPSGTAIYWTNDLDGTAPPSTTLLTTGVAADRINCLRGVVVVAGVGGDVTLNWAQNTTSATPCTLLAGSWLGLTKL